MIGQDRVYSNSSTLHMFTRPSAVPFPSLIKKVERDRHRLPKPHDQRGIPPAARDCLGYSLQPHLGMRGQAWYPVTQSMHPAVRV